MRLTATQKRNVESLSLEYSVGVESPELAVRQALDAILVGDAHPIAWEIAKAAGVIWVTPTIWVREDSMTAETAREIITQALADETWETPVPDDDEQALKDAATLVGMAEDAWEQNIRGPEVEAILKIAAAGEEGGSEVPKAAAKPKPGAKKPAPGKKPKPAPKAAEPDPEPVALEEPWEDYDKHTVKDIVEGIEVWGEEGGDENHQAIADLYTYESANKNRKNIIAACVAALPEEMIPTVDDDPAEAEVAAHEDPENEPEVVDGSAEEIPEEWTAEPYDGYDGSKVADIKEALDDFFGDENYSDEDKLAFLGHVTYYEAANKDRGGLNDYLAGIKTAYEEAQGGNNEEGAPEEEGSAEGAAPPQADASAASGSAGSASRGKKAASAAAEGGSSVRVFVVRTTIDDITLEYELGGKNAVAGTVLDLIEAGATSITIDG